MNRHIIITSCTKNKSTQLRPGELSVAPGDYLANPASIALLESTRSAIFARPDSAYYRNAAQHYAFDLYVRDPRTQLYRGLREENLAAMVRDRLLSTGNKIDWYFLSGGYGLLHAMERARPYQATFDNGIARRNDIPWTLREWKPVLPSLLDEIFSRTGPLSVSVFGSAAYVNLVLGTGLYKTRPDLFDINLGRANKPALTAALVKTVRRLFPA